MVRTNVPYGAYMTKLFGIHKRHEPLNHFSRRWTFLLSDAINDAYDFDEWGPRPYAGEVFDLRTRYIDWYVVGCEGGYLKSRSRLYLAATFDYWFYGNAESIHMQRRP